MGHKNGIHENYYYYDDLTKQTNFKSLKENQ